MQYQKKQEKTENYTAVTQKGVFHATDREKHTLRKFQVIQTWNKHVWIWILDDEKHVLNVLFKDTMNPLNEYV